MLSPAAILLLVLCLLHNCRSSASSNRYKDLLDFYEHFNSVKSIDTIQKLDLCKQKWQQIESLFGRNSQYESAHEHLNGRAGKGILIVHVGKAAGGTVGQMLKNNKLSFTEIHTRALDEQMVREHSVILICLRNPVERAVSAFYWRMPGSGRPLSKHWEHCGTASRVEFYKCCSNLNEYITKLTEISRCGTIARIGECHLELDTCAHVGGVIQSLKVHREKVFIINTESIIDDLNAASNKLGWHKNFTALSGRIHSRTERGDTAQNMTTALSKLGEYMELTGEARLYRLLHKYF